MTFIPPSIPTALNFMDKSINRVTKEPGTLLFQALFYRFYTWRGIGMAQITERRDHNNFLWTQ